MKLSRKIEYMLRAMNYYVFAKDIGKNKSKSIYNSYSNISKYSEEFLDHANKFCYICT